MKEILVQIDRNLGEKKKVVIVLYYASKFRE